MNIPVIFVDNLQNVLTLMLLYGKNA